MEELGIVYKLFLQLQFCEEMKKNGSESEMYLYLSSILENELSGISILFPAGEKDI